MQLARYITPINAASVFVHLRVVLQLLSAVLAPSAAVALISREFFFAGLFGGMAMAVFLLGWVKTPRRKPDLELKDALVVTALAYLVFAIVGGLAFLPMASFVDGFFEAMSGFTTTGLTTLDVAPLPNSLLFFRASAQWVGGAGIIVITLVILTGPGQSAFRLYAAEFGGENLVGNVIATARIVLVVYGILTAAGFLALWAAGLTPFDSLLTVLTTVSTGGFSPNPGSIGQYQKPAVEMVITLFMVLGAVSFPLYYMARREGPKRLFGDLQFRYLIAIIIITTVVFIGALGWRTGDILPGLFQATSAITGTGFNSVDISAWPEGPRLLMVLLMLLGGSVGSTTGGIKLLRLVILVKLGFWLLVRTMLPREATMPPIRYGSLNISENELRSIVGFLLVFLLVFFFSALALVFAGFSATDSLFESASAIGTVGMSSGITSADAALWVKLLVIFEMWVGRLEMLPALVLLYPGTWKWRRRSR